MRLYFVRHGHAEDAQAPDYDDAARALTTESIARIVAAGSALNRLHIKPARLYSSPRVRARQTAESLAQALGVTVMVMEAVNFGFNPRQAEALIVEASQDDEIMFVGHEPDMSMTVAALIGGGEGEIVMKKGSIARVDVITRSPLRGALVWLLAPHVLDALGG
jgi:phosphohistidine phosphatase